MRNQSISTKLFIITSLLFIVFITLMLVLHTYFFESYYKWKKADALKDGLSELRSASTADPNQIGTLLYDYQKKYNATIGFVAQTPDGFFQVMLPLVQSQASNLVQLGNSEQLSFNVIPITVTESDFTRIVTKMTVQWKNKPDIYEQLSRQQTTVIYKQSDDPSLSNQMLAVSPLLSEKENVMFQSALLSLLPSDNLDVLAPVTVHSYDKLLIVVLASLQPVGEAVNIFKQFYPYFYAFALLIILLMIFLYSRMLSRPLVRLNAAASQMAQLDFKVQCEVKSEDEIGNLGKTLNFLSTNLQEAITQLSVANDQLKQDIEHEKRLDKLRKEFVAGVSHELKTPLSLISGYAEGLRDGVAHGRHKKEYLDVILDETANMTHLISDMLDLSQLESGKFKMQLTPFPLNDLIRLTFDKLVIPLTEKQIELRLVLPVDTVIVIGDPQRIEQVLKNLMSNAIRHAGIDGRITLTLHETPGTVRITVNNTGEPIPQEALAHIWDTFYTIDPSRNRQVSESVSGTGIGLAIVKSILTLHQSEFGAINELDGVTFYFSLQLHETNTLN